MRTKCWECTHKHLCQAFVLLCEYGYSPTEYAIHLSFAIGHLAEACDECPDATIATEIREIRQMLKLPDNSADRLLEALILKIQGN